jgi:hypothetical protein
MHQIHQQKREIVQHVDAGDRLGKLEGVEQQQLPIEQADIAEVQIAVAAPHLPSRSPLVE